MSIAMRRALIIAPASAIISIYAGGSHGQIGPPPFTAAPPSPMLPNPLPANPAEPNPLPRNPGPTPGTPYPNQGNPSFVPFGPRVLYYCPYYAQYYAYAPACPGGWRVMRAQ
jgi:hypothetical protein